MTVIRYNIGTMALCDFDMRRLRRTLTYLLSNRRVHTRSCRLQWL